MKFKSTVSVDDMPEVTISAMTLIYIVARTIIYQKSLKYHGDKHDRKVEIAKTAKKTDITS
jgi:hypothetical protein